MPTTQRICDDNVVPFRRRKIDSQARRANQVIVDDLREQDVIDRLYDHLQGALIALPADSEWRESLTLFAEACAPHASVVGGQA